VVHFVIAMVLFAFFCDVVGYLTRNSRLYEVSWWNMFFATISIFIAVIFGQIEAGLSQPYNAVVPALNLHTLLGWSLTGIVAALTGWRYVIRSRDPKQLPVPYLGAGLLLTLLVLFQTYLGDKLVWVYGLHTIQVVEATKGGIL
jgi:uncharacterized membrane protein